MAQESNFAIVTPRTAAPSVWMLLLDQMDREGEDTDWVINRLKGELAGDSQKELDGKFCDVVWDIFFTLSPLLPFWVRAWWGTMDQTLPKPMLTQFMGSYASSDQWVTYCKQQSFLCPKEKKTQALKQWGLVTLVCLRNVSTLGNVQVMACCP